MEDVDRRRSHAETESRRAKRINDGIMALRELMLADSYVCPKDKAGILTAAAEYMQELQSKLKTVSGAGAPSSAESAKSSKVVAVPKAPTSAWPPGIDYRQVFLQSSLPQVISSMDGRFLECSDLFLRVTGYARDEILDGSIFTLTPAEDLPKTFQMFSEMMNEVQFGACTLGDRVPPRKPAPAIEGDLSTDGGDEVEEEEEDGGHAGIGRISRRRLGVDAASTIVTKGTPRAEQQGAPSGPAAGSKRSHKQISHSDRIRATEAIVRSFASPAVSGSPSVSRAFNKVCKLKAGLALVHVRMSLITEQESGTPMYMLCTILPLAVPQGNPAAQYAMPLAAVEDKNQDLAVPASSATSTATPPAAVSWPPIQPTAERRSNLFSEDTSGYVAASVGVTPASDSKADYPTQDTPFRGAFSEVGSNRWPLSDVPLSDLPVPIEPGSSRSNVLSPLGDNASRGSLTPLPFDTDLIFPVKFPFDQPPMLADSMMAFSLDGVNSMMNHASLDNKPSVS